MTDWAMLFDAAGKLTVTVLLAIAVIGVIRGWWVPQYIYKAKERECEEWKRLALEGTTRLRNAVEVLKQ